MGVFKWARYPCRPWIVTALRGMAIPSNLRFDPGRVHWVARLANAPRLKRMLRGGGVHGGDVDTNRERQPPLYM